jgi:hypothetical protein
MRNARNKQLKFKMGGAEMQLLATEESRNRTAHVLSPTV